jgi:hypothetical protein
MRFVPDGVYREPVGEQRPAAWYVVWLGQPHAEGSVVIGRTKRLRRHLHHRCFPESGGSCEDIKGWVAGVEWLLEVHKRAD